MKSTAIFLCLTSLAFGQGAGVTPPWGIQPMLRALVQETQRLNPILRDLQPQDWVAKGAPESYVQMHGNVLAEIRYLSDRIGELEKDPERMTPALEAYFRLQSLEAALAALGEGVRRYQNPALADLILGVISENENNRSRLRSYLVELVSTKEHELRIMDNEAQRCRGTILRQPPARTAPPKPAQKPVPAAKP